MEIVPQLIFNSLIAGAVYLLMATGFNLIFGAARFFNLAHGVMAAIGGYVVFLLAVRLGVNSYASVVAGAAFAGLAGYGLDFLVFRPLRRRKASNMVMLVASLGVFSLVQAVIAVLFTSQFQVLSVNAGGPRTFAFLGGVVTGTQTAIFACALAVSAALLWLLNRTMFGKAVSAVSDDEEVARIVGIDTDRVIGRVFFIGSSLAGLAGILTGFDTGIEPSMGMNLLLKGVIASIIGGVGSVYGSILGAFLLGFVENFGIWKIPGEWKDAIAFVLLVLFLLFRPGGIIKR